MAATFVWIEDTGTATGAPAHGTTRTNPATDCNWKNSGVVTDAYSSFPITVGNYSFQKVQYGKFTTGTFNNISAGLYAHTTTSFGANIALYGQQAVSSDATRWLYTTPAATQDTNLTTNMTAVTAIASGVAVWFGVTGPEATGKAATYATGADVYTTYMTTQLYPTAGVAAGDTANVTMTLQYNEN